MLSKLSIRVYVAIVLALSLSGCSAIRGVGNALANSLKGFHISFPTIRFP